MHASTSCAAGRCPRANEASISCFLATRAHLSRAPPCPRLVDAVALQKIAQLNASIDEVAAQLKGKEGEPLKVEGAP
jgi:hypothetical protein